MSRIRCYTIRERYYRDDDAGKPITVPQIIISGSWLQALGFAVGTKVRVIAREGLIVLKHSDPPQNRDR